MLKKFFRFFLIIAIVYTGVILGIYFNQRNLQYHPNKEVKDVAAYDLGDTTEIFLTTSDGAKIQTWVHMPKPGMPMTIWYHGNAHHLGQRAEKFKQLIDLGYGFIAPSWQSFGKSDGVPSQAGIYEVARLAIKYSQQLGFKTEDTILIGESLGSGIASQMATEHKFKGVFLITPYTTIADRAQEMYWYLPVKYLTKDNFNNIDNISRINAPVLIVHGDDDDIIPHSHSQKLFEKALEPKKLIIYPGKHHSDLDVKEIFTEMDKFLNDRKTEADEQKIKE
jgi:hypothetical protein